LCSSPNPSRSGQTVTLTATVTAVAPGSGTRASNASFYDGGTCASPGTALATNVALNGSGVATTSTSTLSVTDSPHSLIACYAGNANYNASSGAVSQTVNKSNTTTSITNSLSTATVIGQSYNVNFSVAAS